MRAGEAACEAAGSESFEASLHAAYGTVLRQCKHSGSSSKHLERYCDAS